MEKFNLVGKPQRERDKFIVTVKADSNDGDYMTERTAYTPDQFERRIPYLIDLIDNYSGSHKLETYRNEGELDLPYNEYGDYGMCHTLEEVTIEYVDNDGITWDVELNREAFKETE